MQNKKQNAVSSWLSLLLKTDLKLANSRLQYKGYANLT